MDKSYDLTQDGLAEMVKDIETETQADTLKRVLEVIEEEAESLHNYCSTFTDPVAYSTSKRTIDDLVRAIKTRIQEEADDQG